MAVHRTRVRPLLLRPGARYACFGDGLCCTDIHGLGPLTRRELMRVRRMCPQGAGHDPTFGAPMLRTRADGVCMFADARAGCSIHARWGVRAKPGGCRRFPFGLVATPGGGRVTTDHRCPCRTMGARPPLEPHVAEEALVDDADRLVADRRVERVSLDPHRHVSFGHWQQQEQELLARIGAGEPAERVLQARPFTSRSRSQWLVHAQELIEAREGTRFGLALAWFGDAIVGLRGQRRPALRARPWAGAFDRAEGRTGGERHADAVLRDWLMDALWSLAWTEQGSFAKARGELVTQLEVARWIAERIRGSGTRGERGAAEAVMIVELVATSDHWPP